MGGIVMAWLFGEGLVTWRWAKSGAPPTPGALALSSGFFALCGALAIYQPARSAATLLAVGIDVAALLEVLPGSKTPKAANWPPALINDPTVILPTGAAAAVGGGGNPANTPGAVGGANKANGAPSSTPANPGTPPQPGTGVIYPPGSQNI